MKLLILIFTLFSFNTNAAIERHVKDGGSFGSTILSVSGSIEHGAKVQDTLVFSKKESQKYCIDNGYKHISECKENEFYYDYCSKDSSYIKICVPTSLLIYNHQNCKTLGGYIWKGQLATECKEGL